MFCGEPLMNGEFSRMLATAKIVEGDTSSCPMAMLFHRFSAVSFTPTSTSAKGSVFAVQRTMTLSRLLVALKSLYITSVVDTGMSNEFPRHPPNILPDLFNVLVTGSWSGKKIVSPVLLVEGDEVRIINARHRLHECHRLAELIPQGCFTLSQVCSGHFKGIGHGIKG